MDTLERKIKQLPLDLQKKAEDFIDSLLTKRTWGKKKKPRLNWIGGLKEYRDQYTALELQEMASKWRD